jgi:hypothetical protein
MNPDQENFESLRILLAWKRHESPPPRYFSELPSRIWTRIEREPVALPFWQRFFPNIGISPAFAYSFGLLACGTLFFGVAYSLKTDSAQTVAQPFGTEMISPQLASENGTGMNLPYQQMQMASTNPVMNTDPLPSLFTGVKLHVEPVSFSPGR